MKNLIQPLEIATTAILLASIIGVTPLPAKGQTVPRSILNSLVYPTSSQRFFEEGYNRLEREIQRLQEPAPATPVLSVNPEVREQQDWPQWEPQLREPLPNGGDRLPPELPEAPAPR